MTTEYQNTERWEQWLEKGGITRGRDVDMSVPFPADLGCGVQKTYNGKAWIATREYGGRDKKYFKTVTLEISTFRGISIGAQHYYGNLHAPSPEFTCPTEKYTHGSSGSGTPEYLKSIKVELTRVLTQKEIDDDPQRWEYYYAGSNTDCFDTVEEVIAHSKEVFKRLFPKGWKFVIKKTWSGETITVKR